MLHVQSVLGDLFNESGILAPGNSPGITSVSGNYGQGSAATLEIELGGLTAGQFDQLQIGGDASWDGMLGVLLFGGFSLGANQQFLIAAVSGTQTGLFTGLGEGDLVGNFGGRDLFITYNGFGGTGGVGLFTVPEPGSAGLLGGCLLLGWMLRRRRKCQLPV
jgi:hypothetical protein